MLARDRTTLRINVVAQASYDDACPLGGDRLVRAAGHSARALRAETRGASVHRARTSPAVAKEQSGSPRSKLIPYRLCGPTRARDTTDTRECMHATRPHVSLKANTLASTHAASSTKPAGWKGGKERRDLRVA